VGDVLQEGRSGGAMGQLVWFNPWVVESSVERIIAIIFLNLFTCLMLTSVFSSGYHCVMP
jgi:hypothetical protein